MAITNTEKVISLLNYGLVSRLSTSNGYASDSYPSAIKGIIDIYSKTDNNLEDKKDFMEQVSLVHYLDNHDCYPNIDELPNYCEQVITTTLEKNNSMSL